MTAKAALAKALLDGRVLNVKNCFATIGLTNCAREISRMIEQPFGVKINRVHREGKSRYGQPVTWVDYFLTPNGSNAQGVKKMREYVKKEMENFNPTTDNQIKSLKQSALFP